MKANPLTAIVLAGGRSQRMGTPNKLLLEIDGQPVLARVLRAFAVIPDFEIIVVTGAERTRVAEAVQHHDVRCVHNRAYRSGMASSIRCGVRAAAPTTAGYAICPGDLPLLTAATVRRIGEAFTAHEGPRRIVLPTCEGRPGHPVVFGRSFRTALLQLEGDRGARPILQRHEQAIGSVDVEDEGIFRDVDTPEALRAVRKRIHHSPIPSGSDE